MPIRTKSGAVLFPTVDRIACPGCTDAGGKLPVLLRVVRTRPVEPPQVYERDYRCPKCGYTTSAPYVLPRRADDYLSDEDLAARAERVRRG